MNTGSALDRLIQRFQHRWETDPRWRSAMSAALALVAVVTLCVTVFGVANATGRVLVGLGVLTGSQLQGGGTPDTGAQLFNGSTTFPTPTVSLAAATVPPISTIADSQTPAPTPTPPPAPSPTPTSPACTSNCGGPPPTVTISVTGWSPATWANGQTVTITVSTSVGNDGFGLIILFPTGNQWLSASNDPGLQTDGSGNGSYSFTIPSGFCATGLIDVKVQVQEGGSLAYGPDAHIPCA